MAKSRGSSTALDRSPSHLLHRVLQLALDLYAEEAGPACVTQRQYAVLCAVAADEGVSQTGLVRVTGIDRSTLADMVARMIAKGLLVRERSAADGRANTVRLTETGRTALVETSPHVAAADQRILALLGAKKRDAFVDALRRLSRAGEAGLGPDPSLSRTAAPPAEPEKRPKPKKGAKSGKKTKAKSKAASAQPEPIP